jgi:hypothetical protein
MRLRHISILLAFAVIPVLATGSGGCASETHAHHEDLASGVVLRPDPGVVRSHAREPVSVMPGGAFDPLTLSAPSAARLASGEPGPGYWQQRADYRIEAVLDADDHQVRATERITYTNNSPSTLQEVWIHLEQNLYKPGSIGAVAGSEDFGLGGVPKDFAGGYEIDSVAVNGERVEMRVFDTLGRIDLPRPLGPGGQRIEIDIAWRFDIPPYGSDRMGYEEVAQGTIFLLAQWFPAIAKFDDVHGWNALPYMSVGEFYTDFGDYEVAITVPRGHLVGATGEIANPDEVLTAAQRERLDRAMGTRETVMVLSPDEVGTAASRPAGEGPLTWRFKAKDVRTFAWCSSDAFIWDAAAVDGDSTKVGGTLCMSLYPKEGAPLWKDSTDMLRFSIEHYNEKWFRYPYPVAYNVNGHVPGMEYPMIVYCGDRGDEYGLYSVTTHEIGHNWFPMVVNTDERRYAWMDEGFNTFINYYSEIARYGKVMPYYDFEGWNGNFQGQTAQPMQTTPDRMWPGALGWLAYDKPAWMMIVLRERVMGPERFDLAFRAYIERWKFKSPRPEDFFRTMENVGGMDLAWFWRAWVYSTAIPDQGIGGVYPDRQRDRVRITITSGPATEARSPGMPDDMPLPVFLRLTFDDGSAQDIELPAEVWSRSRAWTATAPLGGKTLTRVEIDPERVLPDIHRGNNTWPTEQD